MDSSAQHGVAFKEAFWVWVKVALLSFGGPAGQIAVMHRILVEEKRWINESRFLHALNYCMLLPGPEAQQLATYIGWLLHRTAGGLMAGTLFVLPGFLSILLLSILYAMYQRTQLVQGLFFGLKAAVLAVVLEAVIRIGKKSLKNEVMMMLSAVAFVAIFFFNVPFPLIILSAGILGFLGGRFWEEKFYVIKGEEENSDKSKYVITSTIAAHTRPSWRRAFRVLAVWLILWFLPLAILISVLGRSHVLVQEGIFFSKAAVVTFGGAYSVLAYIAQQAVNTYGWLLPGEMLDGLGMAETTPGPLIMVVQFVGFLGAYRNSAPFDPVTAGVLGSVLTTWVTFTPCFLWIFLGAPYVEHLRGNKLFSSALSTITAAVVGVVLNLAVWFFLHVIFSGLRESHALGMRLLIPEWETFRWAPFVIAVGAFIALFRFRQGMIQVLATSTVIGLLYYSMWG
jgi:chromate transporter